MGEENNNVTENIQHPQFHQGSENIKQEHDNERLENQQGSTQHLEKYKRLNETRNKICPFLLRLFCREGSHHSLLEFGDDLLPLEEEIRLHAWKNTSLGELSLLLKHVYQQEIQKDNVVSFKIVYYDSNLRKYSAKDAGAVIYGRRSIADDKTLAELKFFIGDYLSIAILPPQPLNPVKSEETRRISDVRRNNGRFYENRGYNMENRGYIGNQQAPYRKYSAPREPYNARNLARDNRYYRRN
ncbi:SAP18-domain-containing protein [Neoconidiobolus thromboides FSU 785]|nr:SAP18-domain-containing protein [Neoconidiobolus thromboides FSU 785]